MGKNTVYNKYDFLRDMSFVCFTRAYRDKLSLADYIELKKKRRFDHPDWDKIGATNRTSIFGINRGFFEAIQSALVEWKLYYSMKNGKVKFVDKWEQLPLYIKKSGMYKGNHFWKGTKYPWGNTPSQGMKYTEISLTDEEISLKKAWEKTRKKNYPCNRKVVGV